jgi:hypothetical protein
VRRVSREGEFKLRRYRSPQPPNWISARLFCPTARNEQAPRGCRPEGPTPNLPRGPSDWKPSRRYPHEGFSFRTALAGGEHRLRRQDPGNVDAPDKPSNRINGRSRRRSIAPDWTTVAGQFEILAVDFLAGSRGRLGRADRSPDAGAPPSLSHRARALAFCSALLSRFFALAVMRRIWHGCRGFPWSQDGVRFSN